MLCAGAGGTGRTESLAHTDDLTEAEGPGRGLDLIPNGFLSNRDWDCSPECFPSCSCIAAPPRVPDPLRGAQPFLPVNPIPFSIFTATVSQLLPLLMPKAEASTTFPKAPWPRTLPVEAGGPVPGELYRGAGEDGEGWAGGVTCPKSLGQEENGSLFCQTGRG